ncbi:hypothetical protein [Halosegnis longus]|uniref:hypothetical protein n=1 Tax=Halosegnis longus TaxID=2216012 RepID=UPI00129DC7B7|nr:hypothetical protein [Halosegnis longus]
MVSETPTRGRCGSRVTTKSGLEVHERGLDEYEPLTDQSIVCLRLLDPSGSDIVECEPEYDDLNEYLWSDYEPSHVALTPDHEAEFENIDLEFEPCDRPPVGEDLADNQTATTVGDVDCEDSSWFDLTGQSVNVTNRYSELEGYCERYPMDNGLCYVHGGASDLGAPEGNANAMIHGMEAKRTTYWNSLETQERANIEAWVDDFLDDAPFTRDHRGKVNELYRACIDMHRAAGGLDEYVDPDGDHEGLTKQVVVDTDENGDEVYAEGEHPANLPYSRLDSDITSKLETLGVMSSPEQQKADAEMSIAQKLSGMGDE